MSDDSKPNGAAGKLPTALDIALEKTPKPELAPFTAVLQSGGTPKEVRGFDLSPKTIDLILWNIGFYLLATWLAAKEKLNHLQAVMVQLEAKRAKFGPNGVAAEVNRQREAVVRDPLSADKIDSRETIAHNYRARASAFHAQLIRITRDEVLPTVEPVIKELENALLEWLREQEAARREDAEIWGIPYQPDPVWIAHAMLLVRIRNRLTSLEANEHAHAKPSDILQNINL